jgi:hypothetical protein
VEKLRKNTRTAKSMVNSVKDLDLLLQHPIHTLALVIGGFLVSLSLLKFGILGCVGKGAAPLLG